MIRTQLNYDHTKSKGEKTKNPSLTEPQKSMSPTELLMKYQSGEPVNLTRRAPVYLGEDEMPDLSQMDLIDVQEYSIALKERQDANKKIIKKFEDEFKRRKQAEMEERKTQQTSSQTQD